MEIPPCGWMKVFVALLVCCILVSLILDLSVSSSGSLSVFRSGWSLRSNAAASAPLQTSPCSLVPFATDINPRLFQFVLGLKV